MGEAAVTTTETLDPFAISSYLATATDPVAALTRCSKLLNQCYWEAKDIAAVRALGPVALAWGLQTAGQIESADEKIALLRCVKALSYNLASFLWSGWNEEGIALLGSDAVEGSAAAKTHWDVACMLALKPIEMSRARWLLGAFHLECKNPIDAEREFARATVLANEAVEVADVALNDAYSAIARCMAEPRSDIARERYRIALQTLNGLEHGAEFAQQVETAAQVFLEHNK